MEGIGTADAIAWRLVEAIIVRQTTCRGLDPTPIVTITTPPPAAVAIVAGATVSAAAERQFQDPLCQVSRSAGRIILSALQAGWHLWDNIGDNHMGDNDSQSCKTNQ